jgi:fused signal recognition particle receptor
MLSFFKKNQNLEEQEPNQKTSLRDRLFKSRQRLGDGLASILLGKKQIDDDLLDELEMLLIGADIGIDTTDKVLESIRKKASRKTLKDEDSLYQLLKDELESLLVSDNQLVTESDTTFVILVVGINGAGKTTTIGKLAKSFQDQGKSVMLAAGDTFRAAAVEQLKVWGERNNIPVIAQKTGTDSASVVYDAYQSALAKNVDILIADTAGRLHTQDNLMQELKKIKRVLKKHHEDAPHETMLVIDGGSGQNAVQQAREFNKTIELSGISVTKLDGTAKGGVLFAISDVLNLPIRYIGVGEGIDDLRPLSVRSLLTLYLTRAYYSFEIVNLPIIAPASITL